MSFLSFHGLTGESRKALDARLRTSSMTDKTTVYGLTNDAINNSISERKLSAGLLGGSMLCELSVPM